MKNILMPLWLSAAVLVSVPADAASESLEKLLGGIKADIAAKRLSSPAGNNALEKIDAFREEAPFDFRVVPLTYEWGETYVALAESAIASKDYAKAQGYLDKVWLVAALTPGLEEAQGKLDKVYKGKPAIAAKAEDKGPTKEELARQKKLAEAAAKEKARVEAERARKAAEQKRLAAEAKKQAEEDRKRKAEAERLRRAEVAKAEKEAAQKRVANAQQTKTPAPVSAPAAKPKAPRIVNVASRQQRSEASGLWKGAKEESAPIAKYPVSAEMVSERNRKIVDSLEPVCKAILDNDASVVVHTTDKADYRWLTVRLTLCLRRMDKTFRLRHSYDAVADAEPFVTLHPPREVSLVRQSSD